MLQFIEIESILTSTKNHLLGTEKSIYLKNLKKNTVECDFIVHFNNKAKNECKLR